MGAPDTLMAICPSCKAPFAQRRPWQRFCSKGCRRGFHKAGGEAGLAGKVAELEQRVRDLEAMVWPTGK